MIGTPNHLHFEHINLALDAGWPVFAEKPIVRTAAETLALAHRLANEKTPPLFIGLVMRSMPIVREVIGRVDRGDLGEIVSIDATEHLPPEHGAYLARNWRRRAEWGGSYFPRQGLPRLRHPGPGGAGPRGPGGELRRPPRLHRRPGGRAPHLERRRARLREMDGGWMGANDAFQSDMDVTDHQTAILEYDNQVRLTFHANSHTSLPERRWYVAGTEGTLLADLARNKLMIRPALSRKKPERIEYGGVTADAHNGADQAMALDLLAADGGPRRLPGDALRVHGGRPHGHGYRRGAGDRRGARLPPDVGPLRRSAQGPGQEFLKRGVRG
jgi:predicted dehydrogenase